MIPVTTAPVESRKTVTELFCDVSGSTERSERLDPEALRAVIEAAHHRQQLAELSG